ncbi:MAG: restriction endonuclease subunit S [Leptospiraceae bacterium]|nr:restriction endonuclease subunit S [Leptospiraceae bacterium]
MVTKYTGGSAFLKLEYTDAGVPVLAKGDVKSFGRLIHSGKRYFPEDLIEKKGFPTTEPGDYLLTTRDLTQEAEFLGLLSPIPSSQKYCINQGANLVRFDHSKVDERYIVYWVNSYIYRAYIKSAYVGSTQIHIRKDDWLDAPLYLPPLSEQKAIAHILGTLDDKIELNRKMNQTLEELARALFKSWFVDFDPVKKKMRGEPTGLPLEIDALFPSSLQSSELGDIPQGWRVGKLGDVIEVNPSRSLKKGSFASYLEMSNLSNISARAVNWYKREFKAGTKFMNGDTLLARITPCLENGKTCFVDFLNDNEIAWGSTEYIVLRSKQPLSLTYTYFLARDEMFRKFAISNMTGTSGRQRVPPESLLKYPVIVPSSKVCDQFQLFSDQILQKLKSNDEESQTLTNLRDTLLPKLISGQIRIKDAEKFVAGVG